MSYNMIPASARARLAHDVITGRSPATITYDSYKQSIENIIGYICLKIYVHNWLAAVNNW